MSAEGLTAYTDRLRTYRDRLLQLDWRNRSILLRSAQRRWSFDLGALATVNPEVAEEALTKVIGGKGRVRLVRDSLKGKMAVDFRETLTQVARWSRLVAEESGLQDTFLGFPFLVGHADPERFVRAPLVLFPIRLEYLRHDRVPGWYLACPGDATPILNRALLAALRRVQGIALDDDFQDKLEEVLELASKDRIDVVGAYLQYLAQALVEAGLPIRTRKGETSSLVELHPLASGDLETMASTPLHLEPVAVLGSFPQASTAIYQDYETLLQRTAAGDVEHGVVADLIGAPGREGVRRTNPTVDLDHIPDRALNFALPSDGSQDAVVAEAQGAECVLVRGPPGTGKSQVIVNLITDALARGEKVLLVCQKRAALDVVHQRLGRAGLSDYAVLLHDARADRRDVYAHLGRRLQADAPSPDPRLERDFNATSGAIDDTIRELNAIVQPLWEEYFEGVRLQELYSSAGSNPDLSPGHRMPIQGLNYAMFRSLLGKLDALEDGYRRFDAAGRPWAGRRSFADLPSGAREEIQATLGDIEAKAIPEALCVPQPGRQAHLLAAIDRFRAGEDGRWNRINPRWRRARRLVRVSLEKYASRPGVTSVDGLREALQSGRRLAEALDRLGVWFQPGVMGELRSLLATPLELGAWAAGLGPGLREFDAMQEHDKLLASLPPPEAAIVGRCIGAGLAPDDSWKGLARRDVMARWIEAIERDHPQLSGDPFPRYIQLTRRLGELLDSRRSLFARRLALDLDLRARGQGLPPGGEDPELNRFLFELTKKRRIKPVRRVMEEYPGPFLRAASCWLVSPEAASEVFPLQRGLFDLVIFDESSQLAVERALPAIYRGRRVVIAGDEKQLRPFDLFRLRDQEPEEIDEVTEAESLLVLAMRSFTPRYLSWHYRSRFQELIDFSNHAFYDGNLQIAANVQRTLEEAPIEFVPCGGRWEERRNPLEAARVVDLVANLLRRNREGGRNLTFGIVTFNDPQRDQILDAIEARRARDEDFDHLYGEADGADRPLDDRPFVKNIENVQGDERDVIIFSVAYGPDARGRLRVQFGSLNQEGGENRLNVAITRARERVVMVASFDPGDLPAEETKNPGPKLLKDYLLYARAVSQRRRGEVGAVLARLNPGLELRGAGPSSPEDTLEAQVAEALRGLGYTVDAQVGFSGYRIDLAVVHPEDQGRYILGIEGDGATFQSARSCRERDVTRRRYLEERGWTMERVWSRNWWRNREGEVARLHGRIQGLASGEPKASAGSLEGPRTAVPTAPPAVPRRRKAGPAPSSSEH